MSAASTDVQNKGGSCPRPFSFVLCCAAVVLASGCRGRAPTPVKPPVQSGTASEPHQPRPTPASLRNYEEVIALPDQDFDLAEAVLVLGEEIGAQRDGLESLKQLDALATAAKEELPLAPDTLDYIDALYATVLDRKAAQPFREDRAEDYDLGFTISKRRGTCLSAGILVLAVARRIGAPLYGAQAPGHFLLRSKPLKNGAAINFDVTRPMPDNWRKLDDDFFRRWYKFDEKTQAKAGYLSPLTDKQVLAIYLASRSGFLATRGEFEPALRDAQRAQQLHPQNPTAALNAGYALESLSRWKEAEAAYRRALDIDGGSVRTLNNLAYLKVRAPKSEVFDPKEAERIIASALKLEPIRAYLHATLAEVKAA
ncbi:MAG TPA: transglutaminase family protein, partial [Planctomycetota bacterium]|nr:transglutaminase family protein [Planctomycetota bacterium]